MRVLQTLDLTTCLPGHVGTILALLVVLIFISTLTVDLWVLFGNNKFVDRDSRGGHNRKIVDENFFKKWSSAMAYVLGFIYADGAVEDCRRSSRTCYLCLINNNLDLMLDILKLFVINPRIQVREERLTKIKGKNYWCKKTYYVRIGNKIIYEDLVRIGLCPKKSLIVRMPIIPEEYFSNFLRGYFDGDGCISIEKKTGRINIIFTSGSRDFLEQARKRIEIYLPDTKSNLSFGSGAFRLRYSGKNALKVSELIYRDIKSAPYLKYKYLKYQNFLSNRNIFV